MSLADLEFHVEGEGPESWAEVGPRGGWAKVTDLMTKRLLVGSRTVDHTQAGLTNLTFLSF